MQLLLLTDVVNPRVSYIVNHIFGDMLGFDVLFTQDPNDFSIFIGPKVSYSNKYQEDSICVTPNGLLFESQVEKPKIEMCQWQNLPAFFETNPQGEISFDIFAASFYLLSRYEEYTPTMLDKHGRYRAEESLAYQRGFIDVPLVDLWVKQLALIIQKKYPSVKIKENEFRFIPTIDIDNAYAFRHKGYLISTLGLAKSLLKLKFNELYKRIATHLGLIPDPFDTYHELFRVLSGKSIAVWFILGGKRSKYDKNIDIKKPSMVRLIKSIAERHTIGIHPSYKSGSSKDMVRSELIELENASNSKITCSRQHFLRLQLPVTYQNLVEMNVLYDYTMGYHNVIGFRASTCTPFKFFDLTSEKELPLVVVPFQVMDRTLLDGLQLSPKKAVSETLAMASRVKEVGGTFVTIWHNESLSGVNEWKGWEQVLSRVVEGIENEI
jgi:hypothetical protein